MRKKILIITFIIILIIQAIIPIKSNAIILKKETDSTPAKKESAKADNSVFDENVTWDWSFVTGETDMPYGLFTPSNAEELGSAPLIVWLHGSGEVAAGEAGHRARGLPPVIDNWTLEGFSSYIVCPQLQGGIWDSNNSIKMVKEVIDTIVEKYNIDTNNIMLVGHSLGGRGVFTIAWGLPGYFAKVVSLSPYNPIGWVAGFDSISEIKVPIVCYAGTNDSLDCINFVKEHKETYGDEYGFIVTAGHADLPKVVFNQDNGSCLRNWTEIIVPI